MVTLRRSLGIRTWLRAPIFWILFVAAILRLIGLGWGLPASDGWDSDGIAPRDFLVGVSKTYMPGDYFTYPPFHLLILTVLTFPGWLAGIINASSIAPADIVSEFIKIPYMTFFALVARLVSAAMSLGTIYYVGKIGEELAGRRAGVCVAGVCALNATLTYYEHTTNLDGPYLFWSSLAILFWVRAIARHDLGQIRWMTLCSVAAIATKDQAYGFLLPQSIFLAVYVGLAIDELIFSRQRTLALLSRLGVLVIGCVALFHCMAVDAAFLNDPRYAAERWLESHASRADLIETYGPNVYLPRFRGLGRVTRIDQTPVRSRSRLPDVDESAEPFELAVSRAPRFIVLSEFWAIRHLTDENEFGDSGRISSAEQKAHFRETAVRKYFRDLRDEKLPYRIRYEAGPTSKFWPPVRVHESINEKILIFERVADN